MGRGASKGGKDDILPKYKDLRRKKRIGRFSDVKRMAGCDLRDLTLYRETGSVSAFGGKHP